LQIFFPTQAPANAGVCISIIIRQYTPAGKPSGEMLYADTKYLLRQDDDWLLLQGSAFRLRRSLIKRLAISRRNTPDVIHGARGASRFFPPRC
jgi:hypothetical protein